MSAHRGLWHSRQSTEPHRANPAGGQRPANPSPCCTKTKAGCNLNKLQLVSHPQHAADKVPQARSCRPCHLPTQPCCTTPKLPRSLPPLLRELIAAAWWGAPDSPLHVRPVLPCLRGHAMVMQQTRVPQAHS